MPARTPRFLRRLLMLRRSHNALAARRTALGQLAEYEAAARRLLVQARTEPGNRGHW